MSDRHLRTSAIALVCGLLMLVAGCGDDESPSQLDAAMGPSATPPAPVLDPLAGAPTAGSCYAMSQAQSVAQTNTSKPVSDCYESHNAATYHVGLFPKNTTSSDPAKVKRVCQNQLAKATGLTQGQLLGSVLEWIWFEPTTTQWSAGARWFRCDMVARKDNRLALLPETDYLEGAFSDGMPDKYARCIRTGPDKDGDGEPDAIYVTCEKKHEYRWAGFHKIPGKKYPGDAKLNDIAQAQCPGIAGTGNWWATWPLKGWWDEGEHRMSCYKNTSG